MAADDSAGNRAEVNASAPWMHEQVIAGGVRLHCVRAAASPGAAGPAPVVLLLHGFPDFWLSWRYQLAALAAAGFDAVAPDLRGYNTSEKPAGVRAYEIEALVADVVALADRYGGGNVFLAGHDWGGIVAWYAAMRHPERFRRLVVINAPHPASFRRDLVSTRQWMHSLYMLFFQLPWLPEKLLARRHAVALERLYRREIGNADALAHGEMARYREVFSAPGSVTGPLNYYRAAFRRAWRLGNSDLRRIEIPTLLLWGDRDPFLRASLTEGLDPWIADLEVRRVPGAGHWLHLDRPDFVSEAMIEFFAR